MPEPRPESEAVLEEFVNDINILGGVWEDEKGMPRPMADPDWIDLAMTYLKACRVLGVEPVYSKDPPDTFE